MKRCLMISGGPLDRSFAGAFLKERRYDFIVAVDAGFSACMDLGIHPDLLVGDFDTFGQERIRAYTADTSYRFDIHQPEKDETDTELALRDIRDAGYDEVDVIGALGGRIDHEISNLHLMVQGRRNGLKVRMYDARNKIFILDAQMEAGYEFRKSELYGTYVSFLPVTETVRGITLTGFKYPLDEKDISIMENPSLCVSNEVEDDVAVMRFADGILICIESRD